MQEEQRTLQHSYLAFRVVVTQPGSKRALKSCVLDPPTVYKLGTWGCMYQTLRQEWDNFNLPTFSWLARFCNHQRYETPGFHIFVFFKLMMLGGKEISLSDGNAAQFRRPKQKKQALLRSHKSKPVGLS